MNEPNKIPDPKDQQIAELTSKLAAITSICGTSDANRFQSALDKEIAKVAGLELMVRDRDRQLAALKVKLDQTKKAECDHAVVILTGQGMSTDAKCSGCGEEMEINTLNGKYVPKKIQFDKSITRRELIAALMEVEKATVGSSGQGTVVIRPYHDLASVLSGGVV